MNIFIYKKRVSNNVIKYELSDVCVILLFAVEVGS